MSLLKFLYSLTIVFVTNVCRIAIHATSLEKSVVIIIPKHFLFFLQCLCGSKFDFTGAGESSPLPETGAILAFFSFLNPSSGELIYQMCMLPRGGLQILWHFWLCICFWCCIKVTKQKNSKKILDRHSDVCYKRLVKRRSVFNQVYSQPFYKLILTYIAWRRKVVWVLESSLNFHLWFNPLEVLGL